MMPTVGVWMLVCGLTLALGVSAENQAAEVMSYWEKIDVAIEVQTTGDLLVTETQTPICKLGSTVRYGLPTRDGMTIITLAMRRATVDKSLGYFFSTMRLEIVHFFLPNDCLIMYT